MTVGNWIKRRRASLQLGKVEDKTDGGAATTTDSSSSSSSSSSENNSNHGDMEVSQRSSSSDDSLPSSTRSNNSKLSALSPANQSFVERFGMESDDDDHDDDSSDEVEEDDEEPRGLFEIDLDLVDVVEIQEEKSTKKKLPKRTSTSAQIVSFFETFRDGQIEEIVFE